MRVVAISPIWLCGSSGQNTRYSEKAAAEPRNGIRNEKRVSFRQEYYRSGRYRTCPSHSPGLLHSDSKMISSTADLTVTRRLTSKTLGIGSPPFIARR